VGASDVADEPDRGDAPADVAPEWLSTAEVARRLSLTPRTVYRLIDAGDLVAYRFGRVIRVRADDLGRFIDASRIVPGTLSSGG
jgi:excisionase family DNA binding protein